ALLTAKLTSFSPEHCKVAITRPIKKQKVNLNSSSCNTFELFLTFSGGSLLTMTHLALCDPESPLETNKVASGT
ncbi:hypothetical protein ACQP3J_34005, partial [Escherichia coli]